MRWHPAEGFASRDITRRGKLSLTCEGRGRISLLIPDGTGGHSHIDRNQAGKRSAAVVAYSGYKGPIRGVVKEVCGAQRA
jgi:hypothetical protein